MRALIAIKSERAIGPRPSLLTYTPGVNRELLNKVS